MGSHSLLQGTFPTPGIKPRSPALQADSLPSEPQCLSSVTVTKSVIPPKVLKLVGAGREGDPDLGEQYQLGVVTAGKGGQGSGLRAQGEEQGGGLASPRPPGRGTLPGLRWAWGRTWTLSVPWVLCPWSATTQMGVLTRNRFPNRSGSQKCEIQVSAGLRSTWRLHGEPFLASSGIWGLLAFLRWQQHHCHLGHRGGATLLPPPLLCL